MDKLLNLLKEKRREIAQREGKELFKIFHNSVLEATATALPKTKEELAEIKGWGVKKIEKYGDEILDIIHRHKNTNQTTGDISQDDVFTVSALLDHLNELLVRQRVLVMGEVTDLKLGGEWTSFSLKDEKEESILRCYLHLSKYQRIGVQIADGMKIKVGGFPRITKRRGELGFVTESIEPIGEGSLKQAYELLKRKLKMEGLFDQKRYLPEFIQQVGLITSREGAVIHDFRNNLKRIGIRIYFYDTRVEGKDAITGIIEAIEWFNAQKLEIDVLVIARGGGSFESLQAFDNELVARAIFASKIPTIAAIGHHEDVPIANLIADKEVSTTTAAAYEINKTWDRLFIWLPRHTRDIRRSFENQIAIARDRIYNILQQILESYEGGIADFSDRLGINQKKIISMFGRNNGQIKESMLAKEKYLQAVDPKRNLQLGYSIIFRDNRVVKSVKNIKIKDTVRAKTGDGQFISTVEKITD